MPGEVLGADGDKRQGTDSMTIVIGLAFGERGDAAARLGAMLARAAGEDLVVAAVAPIPWPSNVQLDEEFRAAQDQAARQTLDRARAIVEGALPVRYVVKAARSVATGLIDVAQEEHASLIVLGSAAGGVAGLVSLGGVAERILHSSEIPICFAPAGYDGSPTTRLTRITVAFGRADHDSGLLSAAAARAAELGVRLRVACFAVRPGPAQGWSIESSAEDLVVGEWAEAVRAGIHRALRAASFDPVRVETVIGPGDRWDSAVGAVTWDQGDLLVIGASTSTVSRFFLGSHASKIVRSSPVPVMIVARTAR